MDLDQSKTRLARDRLVENWMSVRTEVTANLAMPPAPTKEELLGIRDILTNDLLFKRGTLTFLYSTNKRLNNWLMYYYIKKGILSGRLFYSEIDFIDYGELLVNAFGYSDNGVAVNRLNDKSKKLIVIENYRSSPGKNFNLLKEHLNSVLFSQPNKAIIITNGTLKLDFKYDFEEVVEQNKVYTLIIRNSYDNCNFRAL